MVDPGEYNPEIDLFINGFNGSLIIFFHSSESMPCRNKFGSNVGEECRAINSPV